MPATRVTLALRAAAALGLLTLAAPARAADAPAASSTVTVAGPDEPGSRLLLRGRVTVGGVAAGAAIHVYQTDASGAYVPGRPMDEPNARLAARLQTDADGRFEIRTIRPGGYPKAVRLGGVERHIPAHVHLDVVAAGAREGRFQAVFTDDPLLADPYWKDWAERARHPVLTLQMEGDVAVATFAIDLPREP